MSEGFLPYGRQVIEDDDIAAVTAVLRGDYLTTGPEIAGFEADFATRLGTGVHAVACNSATAALHLALDAFDVGPGDVCIVPAITFVATANAARYCGADVVFSDVDPANGLMTPRTLQQAFADARQRFPGQRVRAVLPVHLAGSVCDLEALSALTREAGAVLIADSCHALDSRWSDGAGRVHQVGDASFCDAATFSFHPVKTLACGEGGMVTTGDAERAAIMRRRRSHGIEREADRFVDPAGGDWPWYYEMAELGWNYRMPDINAALGRSQLAKLTRFAARRRALTEAYRALLAPLAPLVQSPADRVGVDACRHLMNVRIDFAAAGVTREQVMEAMRAEGVGTQVHYIPVSAQPYYRARYGRQSLTGAQAYYANTLSLPLYPSLVDTDITRVVAALQRALGLAS